MLKPCGPWSVTVFDIVFISYNEPNADANWNKLRNRFHYARRIQGVTGIHKAHIIAAKTSLSEMVWIVDGDSQVVDDFTFANPAGLWKESVYVYQARNPLNNLAYGYGGIKLLPRWKTIHMDSNSVDMTTSISEQFTAVDEVASITCFNTDPFNTWKSAFRECVKLSSKIIDGQISKESEERLDVWSSTANGDFSEECLTGAIEGRKYGNENAGNIPALNKINNFVWLKEKFNQI